MPILTINNTKHSYYHPSIRVDLIVNNKKNSSIQPKEFKKIILPSGTHTVSIKKKFAVSNRLVLNFSENEEKSIEVEFLWLRMKNIFGLMALIFGLLYISFQLVDIDIGTGAIFTLLFSVGIFFGALSANKMLQIKETKT